ncbi:MAG: murein biosynthesis integral membrane protein MurJ [Candidatus Zixiibacteriota bacterium]
MREPSIRKASVIVIVFTVAAKLTGFVREAVVAGTFGTSRVVDTYLAAIIIPAIITNVLYQALPNAFVPLFAGSERSPSARRLAVIMLIASSAISALMWLTAPWTAALTNSGFDAPLRQETVDLVRIGSLAVAIATIEALARSRLIAQKRFVQSGFAPAWSSLVIILAVVLFRDAGAHALMWGFVIGTAVVAAWNLLPLRRSSESFQGDPVQDGSVHDGWIIVVLAVSTIGLLNGLVDRHFGSFLPEGSLAALQYADLVASQPVAILGIALAGAIFPYLSVSIQSGDQSRVSAILNAAVRWSLFAVIPIGMLLLLFGVPVVRILFERGEFNAASREMTGAVLSVYGLWMIPTVLAAMVAKVHYSLRNGRALLTAMSASIMMKLVVSVLLVDTYGISGLAVGSALASLTYMVLLTLYLPQWSRAHVGKVWLPLCGALTALALAGCGVAYAATHLPAFPDGKLGAWLSVLLAGGVSTALVMSVGPRMGVSESTKLKEVILNRLRPAARP